MPERIFWSWLRLFAHVRSQLFSQLLSVFLFLVIVIDVFLSTI